MTATKAAPSKTKVRQPVGTNHFQLRLHQPGCGADGGGEVGAFSGADEEGVSMPCFAKRRGRYEMAVGAFAAGLYIRKVNQPSNIPWIVPLKNHFAASQPGIGVTT